MVSEVSSSKCEFLDITGRAMTIKIVPHSLICIQYHEKEEINYLEDKPSLTNSSHTSHCLYPRYSGLLILCFILVSTISFAYFSLLGLTLNECEPILSISFQIYAYINTYMHIYIYLTTALVHFDLTQFIFGIQNNTIFNTFIECEPNRSIGSWRERLKEIIFFPSLLILVLFHLHWESYLMWGDSM